MKTVTFFWGLFIAGTAQSQTLDSTHQYIFPATQAVLPIVAKDAVRYTATTQDVQFADSLLTIYLQSLPVTKQKAIVYSAYFRQYVGYTLWGVKKIYVYATCKSARYHTEAIDQIRGGGTCHFKAVVNKASGEVETFLFNAPK